MFAAAFGLLRNYVEVELAYFYYIVQNKPMPRPYNVPILRRMLQYRSRKDGLAQLDWWIEQDLEESGKLHHQIKELYLWYVDDYKVRLDPMDASGYYDAYLRDRCHQEVTEEEKRKASLLYEVLEEQYKDTDTAMFIRLITLRNALSS
jgi:hypothetical protein